MLTKSVRVVLIVLAVLIVLVFAARFTVFATFEVTGSSMADTLKSGDVIFVNKLAGAPGRGDIVVFHSPATPKGVDIKRIVGLPGETLVLRSGSVFLRDGTKDTKLDEPYLNTKNQGQTFRHPPMAGDGSEVVFAIPAGTYFILGDNRQSSLDSRSFQDASGAMTPFVPADAIVGTVWLK